VGLDRGTKISTQNIKQERERGRPSRLPIPPASPSQGKEGESAA